MKNAVYASALSRIRKNLLCTALAMPALLVFAATSPALGAQPAAVAAPPAATSAPAASPSAPPAVGSSPAPASEALPVITADGLEKLSRESDEAKSNYNWEWFQLNYSKAEKQFLILQIDVASVIQKTSGNYGSMALTADEQNAWTTAQTIDISVLETLLTFEAMAKSKKLFDRIQPAQMREANAAVALARAAFQKGKAEAIALMNEKLGSRSGGRYVKNMKSYGPSTEAVMSQKERWAAAENARLKLPIRMRAARWASIAARSAFANVIIPSIGYEVLSNTIPLTGSSLLLNYSPAELATLKQQTEASIAEIDSDLKDLQDLRSKK